MFCYIILHYKVLEETISCVKSIKEGNYNAKQIVI
ncbi:TPA: glycosyltransferase family 2 protein, partial [Streptococcus pneumoniae]